MLAFILRRLAQAVIVMLTVALIAFLLLRLAHDATQIVSSPLAFASLAVIGFAPWAEEIFFRGFLFPGFSRAWGVAAGIIVSGLLFGAVHFLYQSFVPIAAVGLVFAFTYSRSRNLLSTMIAHVAFNSLSIALIAGGSCDSSTSSVILGWWPL